MTGSLTEFQNAFIEALYADEPELPPSALSALTTQSGFAVYRNTVLQGAVDALHANFPTVERLVGREWFTAAAALYARRTPPTDARLVYHGSTFADFLDTFEPAQQMPWLGNVARLDALWNRCHTAADERSLDLTQLACLAPEQLATVHFTPRKAAAWQWFAHAPVFTLWRFNREQRPLPDPLDWHGEGALLVRSEGAVTWHPLAYGECAFLDACAAGSSLAQAAQAAEHAQPDLDIVARLTRLVGNDVFTTAART